MELTPEQKAELEQKKDRLIKLAKGIGRETLQSVRMIACSAIGVALYVWVTSASATADAVESNVVPINVKVAGL